MSELDDDIRYEAEDVGAPAGRCRECLRPFGIRAKDGFMVFKAYGENSGICTECESWDRMWNSREQDRRNKRRKE